MALEQRPLSTVDRGVIIGTVSAAYLSGLLVILLLTHIFGAALLQYLDRRRNGYVEDGQQVFLQRPIGKLVTSLLLCNLLQAVSGMLKTRWAVLHRVQSDADCTVQAALLLQGDVGISIFSLLIAAHTFTTVALHKSWNAVALWLLIVLSMAFVIALGFIGPYAIQTSQRGPFYGITLAWCFITDQYPKERVRIHYVPILICGLAILILYVILFFTVRGSLALYNYQPRRGIRTIFRPSSNARLPYVSPATMANKMLWYPAAYTVIILPITTARLSVEKGHHVPHWVWSFSIIMLHLSGTVNVIIYVSTRRVISPILWSRRESGASTVGLKPESKQ